MTAVVRVQVPQFGHDGKPDPLRSVNPVRRRGWFFRLRGGTRRFSPSRKLIEALQARGIFFNSRANRQTIFHSGIRKAKARQTDQNECQCQQDAQKRFARLPPLEIHHGCFLPSVRQRRSVAPRHLTRPCPSFDGPSFDIATACGS